MGMTFTEKILAKNCGKLEVVPSEIVTVKPDIILSHDNSSAISKTFAKLGVSNVKNPDSIVIILDHCVPAATDVYAENHKVTREFVKKQGIKNFFDINYGVCHQVLPEMGFAKPGSLILGSDSHTTTYGAFGAFSAGIGRSEAAVIWATGEMWLRVPETMKIVVNGNFKKHVSAKDLILKIIGDIGADGALYKAVEFTGSTISSMSISGRMVLCNMAAEMGAKNGYVAHDEITQNWLEERDIANYEILRSDEDATFESTLIYDADSIDPQVACPHSVDNVKPVHELKGLKFHQIVIGTCTNGRIEDLEKAAAILGGKKIAKDIRVLIFPASREVYSKALSSGVIEKLHSAGCIIMNPGCGPCLGAHEGVLAPGEICLSTANRNFKGRMGCKEGEIYLTSPETAAASALTGELVSADML
ncbi:3-isopropylmalate dehydratase large subunit [bacterium]|nr:3-isopropylmalate dehydratase large subunit [bacterium]